MNFAARALLALLCLVMPVPFVAAAEPDAAGTHDHPLFSRMPGFYINRMDVREFDGHEFRDAKGNAVTVEGKVTELMYYKQPEGEEPSRLQIQRNFENAIAKIGGKTMYRDDDGNVYLRVAKDGKEYWAQVNAYITSQYSLLIVERAAMRQDIVASADVFASDIKSTGHAAVYGIYFDTGKSEIKPESEPALVEIAKLMQANPGLKVRVVGHTDSVGAFDANVKLSEARARAVMQALVAKHGVAASRMTSHGVASLAPVQSNETEDGRAKNRRVELVAMARNES